MDHYFKKVDEFLLYLRIDKKYSEKTIESYQNELKKYGQFLQKQNLYYQKVTVLDIPHYIQYLKTFLSPRSIHHNISCMRSFYKFLTLQDSILSPFETIDTPKLKKSLPKVLSYRDIQLLLDVDLKDKYAYRDKAMLELMYATGLRVSELVNVKVNDIDFDMATVKTMGKGSKERIIPIGDVALHYVMVYLKEYRYQFLKKENTSALFLNHLGNQISRQAFFEMVKKQAVKKNIKTAFSPHTLRHSFATHLLDHGADIVSIQEMLGHSSLATTQIYTHISNQKLQDEYRKFHPHG